jgi:hypothetical protein
MVQTKVHVNQHVIKSNHKTGKKDPVLTIKTYKSNTYASKIRIKGPCTIEYNPNEPLSCGARVWINTKAEVEIIE